MNDALLGSIKQLPIINYCIIVGFSMYFDDVPPIVMDNGSDMTRVDFAGKDAPRHGKY